MKYIIFLFPILLFGKIVTVQNEATSLDRQMSKIEALANAKNEASYQFQTEIQNSFTKIANSETGKKMMISQTQQKSNSFIEVVGTPKYRYEKERTSKGVLYTTYVTAKFRLIKKEKKQIISPKIIEQKKIATLKIRKKPIRKRKNFQIFISGLPNFQKYFFLIPKNSFSEKQFSRKSFQKNGKYYKQIKKYLYKFRNGKFAKQIPIGEYYLTFLFFDGTFFFQEKKFQKLEFQHFFKKDFQISMTNFRFW